MVVETSVNVISNSPSQDYTHPDDRTLLYDMTPGFKSFTTIYNERISRQTFFFHFLKLPEWRSSESIFLIHS